MPEYFPLTEPQKSIWYEEEIYPQTSINTIGGYVRIQGNICFDRLQKCLNSFIQAHSGMRIQITKHQGQVLQYVAKWKPLKFPFFDFSLYKEKERLFYEWIQEEGAKPFNLYHHFLFHFAFFRLGENDCGYLIKFHHIIADMYAISLLTEQIKQLYENTNQIIHKSHYFDYLSAEKTYFASKRYELDRSFWLKTLSPNPLSSPLIEYRDTQSKRLTFTIDEAKTSQIQSFINEHLFSLNILFNAVVGIYFYLKNKLIHQIIGIPIFNRKTLIEKQTMGMFVNTLPFYFEINPSITGLEFCYYIKKKLRESYNHHKYPFHLLMRELNQQGLTLKSMMTASVNVYPTRHPTSFDGYAVSNQEFAKSHQTYPFHLIIHEWQEKKIQFHIEYQLACYEKREIETIGLNFLSLVSTIIEYPSKTIEQLALITQNHASFESPPYRNPTSEVFHQRATIIDQFEEQVHLHPTKIAIQDQDAQLSFIELKKRVDAFTIYLEKNGIRNGIAIIGKPSIECVIAILAIQKLGYFYVPFDPQESKERIHLIIQEAQIPLIVYWNSTEVDLHELIIPSINIRDILHTLPEHPVISKAAPNRLAYMIYTSGSTGKPKGVKITHANLSSYLEWAKIYLNHENCVFAFYSSIAFDLTVTSIFLPLINGHKIKVFRAEDQYVLFPILTDPEVTILKATPSHLYLIQDQLFQTSFLKTLIVGGEDLKTDLARQIQNHIGPHLSIYNEYGPTETTVGCMIYLFNSKIDNEESVPIGSAAGQVQLLVLNENREPVEIGEIGELYIGGNQVADGYFNQPDLTEKHFLILRYAPTRFYKTGDLVSQNKHGMLVFHGRKDEQVKMNGYRIELGEIQAILLSFPSIKNSCVIPLKYDHHIFIGGFFVSDKQLDREEISRFLSNHLPSYKIPSILIQIDHIPLTYNGKINKSILMQFAEKDDQKLISNDFQSTAFTTIQSLLKQKVQYSDNFFQVGGDSILAIQISSKLSSQGIHLKVKDILSAKTIGDILATVREKRHEHQSLTSSQGVQPLSSILRWFFAQKFKYPHYYHHSILLQLHFPIRADQIEACLNKVTQHHDAFRLNFNPEENILFYNEKIKNKKITFLIYDFSAIEDQNIQQKIEEASIHLKNQTNIINGYLLSAALIFLKNHEQYVLLCAHHLSIDGLSWQILLQDFNQLISAYRHHQESLYEKNSSHSFQQWVQALQTLNYDKQSNELASYLSHLPDEKQIDQSIQNDQLYFCPFTFSVEMTQQLVDLSNRIDIQISDILTTAFLLSLCGLLNEESLFITLEHHGRFIPDEKINIMKTIGWFTIMCPLYFHISSDIGKTIKNVKNTLQLFYRYAYALALNNPYLEKYPNAYCFNYLGVVETQYSEFSIEQMNIGPDSHPKNRSPTINLNALMIQNQISHLLWISSDLPFSPDRFIQTYESKIQDILNYSISNPTAPYALNLDVHLDEDEIKEIILL